MKPSKEAMQAAQWFKEGWSMSDIDNRLSRDGGVARISPFGGHAENLLREVMRWLDDQSNAEGQHEDRDRG